MCTNLTPPSIQQHKCFPLPVSSEVVIRRTESFARAIAVNVKVRKIYEDPNQNDQEESIHPSIHPFIHPTIRVATLYSFLFFLPATAFNITFRYKVLSTKPVQDDYKSEDKAETADGRSIYEFHFTFSRIQ